MVMLEGVGQITLNIIWKSALLVKRKKYIVFSRKNWPD
jgi:hypothetical protein